MTRSACISTRQAKANVALPLLPCRDQPPRVTNEPEDFARDDALGSREPHDPEATSLKREYIIAAEAIAPLR
jgi:hypothetical protein